MEYRYISCEPPDPVIVIKKKEKFISVGDVVYGFSDDEKAENFITGNDKKTYTFEPFFWNDFVRLFGNLYTKMIVDHSGGKDNEIKFIPVIEKEVL
jgi:hypothetical protein